MIQFLFDHLTLFINYTIASICLFTLVSLIIITSIVFVIVKDKIVITVHFFTGTFSNLESVFKSKL